MAGEAEGEVVVPPTLQALLAARLDQLETAERSVLERGAIEGEIFHRGAVQALAPEETQVTPRLAALVRKELIRPDRPQLAGEDGFRFRHLLIRDAAYDALPKAMRAELHERFAAWLEQHGAELVELDEILGYHLEQACRYRAELGMARRRQPRRGGATAPDRRRAPRAAPAGLRRRRRAFSSAPPRSCRRTRSTSLSKRSSVDALFWAGRGERGAPSARSSSPSGPPAAGDRVGELCGRITGGHVPHSPRAGGRGREAGRAPRARRCPCSRPPATTSPSTSRTTRSDWVATCARRWTRGWRHTSGPPPTRGRRDMPHELLGMARRWRFYGTTPGPELLAWLDEQRGTRRAGHSFPRRTGRRALAMLGRFDEARAILAESRERAGRARRGNPARDTTGIASVDVELLAGDPAAAAEFGAEGCRLHDELGDKGFLSTAAGDAGAGALRARPTRRGRRLGRPRGGARRERRRDRRRCSGGR